MLKRKIGSSFGSKIVESGPHVDPKHLIEGSDLIYSEDQKIGCGGSATVYKGLFIAKTAAFKVYNFENPYLPFVKKLVEIPPLPPRIEEPAPNEVIVPATRRGRRIVTPPRYR